MLDRRGHQARTLGSVCARYSDRDEHASSRDSTLLHNHTPFGAVVAHVGYLAVRRERGPERCVIPCLNATQQLVFQLAHLFFGQCIESHTCAQCTHFYPVSMFKHFYHVNELLAVNANTTSLPPSPLSSPTRHVHTHALTQNRHQHHPIAQHDAQVASAAAAAASTPPMPKFEESKSWQILVRTLTGRTVALQVLRSYSCDCLGRLIAVKVGVPVPPTPWW